MDVSRELTKTSQNHSIPCRTMAGYVMMRQNQLCYVERSVCMTANQIAYFSKVREAANVAAANAEQARANRERERLNQESLNETKRHQRAQEIEQNRINTLTYYETARSNRERERLNQYGTDVQARTTQNVANINAQTARRGQDVSYRQAITVADRQVAENIRANKARESLTSRQQDLDYRINSRRTAAQEQANVINANRLSHQIRIDQYLVPNQVGLLQAQRQSNVANAQYNSERANYLPLQVEFEGINTISHLIGGIRK